MNRHIDVTFEALGQSWRVVGAFSPAVPARTYGPPERCYPEEPAEIEWTVRFPDGGDAEPMLTPEDASVIEAEAAMRMVELDESERDAESLREQHRIMLDALRLIALGNDDSAAIARAAMVRASFE